MHDKHDDVHVGPNGIVFEHFPDTAFPVHPVEQVRLFGRFFPPEIVPFGIDGLQHESAKMVAELFSLRFGDGAVIVAHKIKAGRHVGVVARHPDALFDVAEYFYLTCHWIAGLVLVVVQVQQRGY